MGNLGFFGLIGLVLAVILSWEANHSFGWAVLHAIFGWFYVAYHVIVTGL